MIVLSTLQSEIFNDSFKSELDRVYNNQDGGGRAPIITLYRKYFSNYYTLDPTQKLPFNIDLLDTLPIEEGSYDHKFVEGIKYLLQSREMMVEGSGISSGYYGYKGLSLLEESKLPKELSLFFRSIFTIFTEYYINDLYLSSLAIDKLELAESFNNLDSLSRSGTYCNVEAALFLRNFYRKVLCNYRLSVKYSSILAREYDHPFFFYIYSEDLLDNGEIDLADLYNYLSIDLNSFEPYKYFALLEEIEISIIKGEYQVGSQKLDILKDGNIVSDKLYNRYRNLINRWQKCEKNIKNLFEIDNQNYILLRRYAQAKGFWSVDNIYNISLNNNLTPEQLFKLSLTTLQLRGDLTPEQISYIENFVSSDLDEDIFNAVENYYSVIK